MTARVKMLTICGLAVSLLSARPSAAQEAEYLRFQVESQSTEVNQAASELLAQLLEYPKDVRDAAMGVAQHPELIVRLRYADRSAPGAIGALTLNYPPEVSVAAANLMQQFEVVELLANRLTAAGLLGEVYGRNREMVETAMDRLSERAIEQAGATQRAWQQRLVNNSNAAAQYESVRQAGAQAPARGDSTGRAAPLPSAGLVTMILMNADIYPDLAAEIVDQWERERNPDTFRRAVDLWYARGRTVLPAHFLGDGASRASLLSEYAVFEREFLQHTATLAGEEVAPDRLEFLHQHVQSYPMLRDVYFQKQAAIAAASRPKIAGAPYTSGSSGGSSSSGSTSRSSTRTSSTRPTRTSTARGAGGTAGGSEANTGGRGDRGGRGGGQQGGFGGAGGQSGGFGGGGSSGSGGSSSGFGAGSGGSSSGSGSRTNRISGSSSSSSR